MINSPETLTPVPNHPGYFWDIEKEKLFSLKVGGEYRELTCRRLHPAAFNYGRMKYSKLKPGQLVYTVSVNGRCRYLAVSHLKKLKMVDYDIPLVERQKA